MHLSNIKVEHLGSIASLEIFKSKSIRNKGVVEAIDKFRENCLWRGSVNGAKGCNLAAWELVTMPKEKDGLGVKNLYVQNEGPLIKHLHKF